MTMVTAVLLYLFFFASPGLLGSGLIGTAIFLVNVED